MKPTTLPTHVYQPDGLPDRPGGPEGCQHCTQPRRHPVHVLPPVPADVAAAEARRMGESEQR